MRRLLKTLFLAAAVGALGACYPTPDTQMAVSSPAASKEVTQRVTIERIGIFRDELAYQARRGIYVIKDHKTGREYIGVSGVGITETGVSGKTTAEQ